MEGCISVHSCIETSINRIHSPGTLRWDSEPNSHRSDREMSSSGSILSHLSSNVESSRCNALSDGKIISNQSAPSYKKRRQDEALQPKNIQHPISSRAAQTKPLAKETSEVSQYQLSPAKFNLKENVENQSDHHPFRFIHEDEEFAVLLKMCADELGMDPSYVEKDYYVSHSLWCLRKKGLEIQIKGGVSLSKGFGVITRLSEDVDIIIHPGGSCPPALQNAIDQLYSTDRTNKQKTPERRHLWKKFANLLKYSFPGMQTALGGRNNPFFEPRWVYLVLVATYDNIFPVKDENLLPPNVMLELSIAKEENEPLSPVQLRLGSFLHSYLEQKRILHRFKRNIPTALCTHPMITLVQKIADGIVYRYPRDVTNEVMPPFASGLRGKVPPFDPRIIRHYEDAAAIISNLSLCRPLAEPEQYRRLFVQLTEKRMVRRRPEEGIIISDDQSFRLESEEKSYLLRLCQQQRLCLYFDDVPEEKSAISPIPLEDCAFIIRKWLKKMEM
eukprot:TRINITY_DN666_c0_g1_i1.p1 TRINITY_DN666_c0_g1~~TRINITY_DN666_c0_g1_i1.p1  ORF type:complete len:501 (-),score=90.30 TRINITY_DN666_c0_g1_i1:1398-2900(-)